MSYQTIRPPSNQRFFFFIKENHACIIHLIFLPVADTFYCRISGKPQRRNWTRERWLWWQINS